VDVSLDGKVALVTGAGPNIGSGIALALSRYGARVACNDLEPSAAKAAVRRIERNGGVGLALADDVSVEADAVANIDAVLEAWGRIDIVINNAAWLHAAAMDLAPYGIRVNSFTPTAPRPDNPELLAQWRAEGRTELRPPARESGERPPWWRPPGTFDVRGQIPMGEPATPTDIGHCIAWLCSGYARLITGCDFVIDGVARAKYWAYTPAAEAAAGPVPLIPLDITPLESSDG
jgi:NAD(P)-dependent dehydrogenase (short-subunit alcohol dehydrogenase family)